MVNDQHWATKAACTGSEPDELFVQGAAQRNARAVCMGCGVRLDCLADALDSGMRFGVWGGMTERERRAMLRKQPDVISWRSVLADSGSAALDARCSVAGLPAGRR
jgi:WhiB family transcriptional regulator, redox-sensing transcriptional regulator